MPVQLQWGLNNEENATLKYKGQIENKENVVIKSCGLVISPKWPWLGCSPDGVLLKCGDCIGCLEIKCPYSKNDMTILEAVKCHKTFFLKSTTSGLELKRSHAYFYQCQGIVNILGLPWIDFLVYTDVDMNVERIHKDKNLWERTMLPKLTSFHLTVILKLFIQAAILNTQVTLDSQLDRDYYTILHLPFFGSVNKSPTQRLTMN